MNSSTSKAWNAPEDVTANLLDIPTGEGSPTAPRWRRWLVRLGPYVLTVAVVWGILSRYSAHEIARNIALGEPVVPLLIALVSVIVTLLIVTTADTIVVRYACGPVRWWDMLRGKSGSSLLDVFGYAAGHGGYAVWIQRFTQASPAVAGGSMLYIMSSDLLGVCLVASVASFFAADHVAADVQGTATTVAAILILLMILGPYELFGSYQVTSAWKTVPRRAGFTNVALRVGQTIFWCLVTWAAARAFGLELPLSAMMTYFPIVMLVNALPINVAGFGAVQGAWLLLADFAPGEEILAFQVVWTLIVLSGVVLRGLPFVRGVFREVDHG